MPCSLSGLSPLKVHNKLLLNLEYVVFDIMVGIVAGLCMAYVPRWLSPLLR